MNKGFSENSLVWLNEISKSKENSTRLAVIKNYLSFSDIGKKGIEEIEMIFSIVSELRTSNTRLEFDTTLARGLNYYTGAIIEVKVNDSRSTFTGSLLGGGRYDDLTGIFGLPNVSGVGISFGVDRIYDVMEEMKLFDELNLQASTTQVMFINWNETKEFCLEKLRQVRKAEVNAEIYPDSTKKIGKQYSYADAKNIPYVISIGTSEKEKNTFTLKRMHLNKEEKNESEYSINVFEDIIQKIKNKEEF